MRFVKLKFFWVSGKSECLIRVSVNSGAKPWFWQYCYILGRIYNFLSDSIVMTNDSVSLKILSLIVNYIGQRNLAYYYGNSEEVFYKDIKKMKIIFQI